MSLLDLIKKEDDKYISVRDLIKLIANQMNDTSDIVIEYLCKFCLVDNSDVGIYIKGFANGYSYEFHLTDLLFKDDKIGDFRCYTMSELEQDEDFPISYFLKDEVFNVEYIKLLNLNYDNLDSSSSNLSNQQQRLVSKAPPPPNHIKAAIPLLKQRTISDVVKAEKQKEPILPNGFQQMTMLYDYFTPHQAACFIAGLHPDFNGCDDGLEMGNSVIEGGIKSGKLVADDDGQIKADDLKPFLYSKHWIMEGFNDDLPNDTGVLNQATTDYEKRIADLEQQLADKEANASFMMGSPSVEQGEPKDSEQIINDLRDQVTQLTADNASLKNQLKQAKAEQADAPADDKELAPNSEAKVAKLVYTLLTELKYDLTIGGKGNTNLLIENTSKNLTTPLSPNFIAYWLKKAYQLQIKDINK